MAKYSIAVETSATGSAAPAADIETTSTQILFLTEINISMKGSAGGVFGIGRPANDGSVVQTSSTAVLPHDVADNVPLGGTAATTWSTAPTVPGAFLYRINVPASSGSNYNIQIPEGIKIKPSNGIVLWNITATDVAEVTFILSNTPPAQTRQIV
jgi:hypothetical protein